jgi:selenide, water dikinase
VTGAVGVSACTDVTGFGLLGHLHIALRASGASAVVNAPKVPLLPGTLDLAEAGVVPSGTLSNHEFVSPWLDWGDLPEAEQLVLADAQTSGGLLIAVPEDRLPALMDGLAGGGIAAAEVGVVHGGDAGAIAVRGRIRR